MQKRSINYNKTFLNGANNKCLYSPLNLNKAWIISMPLWLVSKSWELGDWRRWRKDTGTILTNRYNRDSKKRNKTIRHTTKSCKAWWRHYSWSEAFRNRSYLLYYLYIIISFKLDVNKLKRTYLLLFTRNQSAETKTGLIL